jgi:hypothetical protein
MKCTGRNCPMQYGTVNPAHCLADECPYLTKPLTNADRIRAMTDAELAEFLTEHHFGDKLWCERWLKQEVEDDKH